MSGEGSLHALSLLSGRQRSTQHNNLKSLFICYLEVLPFLRNNVD